MLQLLLRAYTEARCFKRATLLLASRHPSFHGDIEHSLLEALPGPGSEDRPVRGHLVALCGDHNEVNDFLQSMEAMARVNGFVLNFITTIASDSGYSESPGRCIAICPTKSTLLRQQSSGIDWQHKPERPHDGFARVVRDTLQSPAISTVRKGLQRFRDHGNQTEAVASVIAGALTLSVPATVKSAFDLVRSSSAPSSIRYVQFCRYDQRNQSRTIDSTFQIGSTVSLAEFFLEASKTLSLEPHEYAFLAVDVETKKVSGITSPPITLAASYIILTTFELSHAAEFAVADEPNMAVFPKDSGLGSSEPADAVALERLRLENETRRLELEARRLETETEIRRLELQVELERIRSRNKN